METRVEWRTATKALTGLAMAAALAFGVTGAQAGGTTQLEVNVTVLKHTNFQVLSQPAVVVVTAQDLARGYVDVPAATQVAVRSNTRDGYLLEFASQGDFLRQIVVRGLDTEVQLSPEGGLVTQRGAATGVTRATLALGFRFLLSASAQPGTYAWPMRVTAASL